ncbi:MAG TPA: hypothetical protein DGR79_08170 [Clostridiales bacterium]|nr:hypothetical protein [Clostridiales bacterium]
MRRLGRSGNQIRQSSATDDMEAILRRIEFLRHELHRTYANPGEKMNSARMLALSRELDRLINAFIHRWHAGRCGGVEVQRVSAG